MLGSAAPATATLHTSTSSATPTSPTRPSRLRGLSYLRSYTHQHLHPERASPRADTPPLTRSTSTPAVRRSPSRTRAAPRIAAAAAAAPASERVVEATAAGLAAVSIIQSGENGWVPTVQGRSGLNREGTNLTSTSTDSAAPEPSGSAANMTRNRAVTGMGSAPTTPAARRASTGDPLGEVNGSPGPSTSGGKEALPTIRFIPHVETRSSRPSLHFTAISKTLKNPKTVVRVGRYSERDNTTTDENTLPVGFKSKVVSRRHCEFWCTDGQWFVKDVKSSSGTFLNHVRLSSPNVESRPYPVNDGDVVQLGIDFKGGEEVIFRCVKIRIECNRGWQKSLNNFNTQTHKRLLKTALGAKSKARNRDSDTASVNSSECSICLNMVAPCQALFVAPCSHVWHFKCVKNLIQGPNYPNFLCPNCRFVADLEADVEPPEEEEFEMFEESLEDVDHHANAESNHEGEASGETGVSEEDVGEGAHEGSGTNSDGDGEPTEDTSEELQRSAPEAPRRSHSADRRVNNITDEDLSNLNPHEQSSNSSSTRLENSTPTTTSLQPPIYLRSASRTPPVPIRQPSSKNNQRSPSNDLLSARSATPTSSAQFALAAGVMSEASLMANGPMTPRNDAGPFVLDGSGGMEASDEERRREDK